MQKMGFGFVKASALTPDLRVADTAFNREKIIECMDREFEEGAEIIVFPELALSGCSCADLFFQNALRISVKEELREIAKQSRGKRGIVFLGLPWEHEGRLYNACAGIWDGEVLGIVPKTNIQSLRRHESRYFTAGDRHAQPCLTDFFGERILFSSNLIFSHHGIEGFRIGVEISEDLERGFPISSAHASVGANLIVNPCALPKLIGADEYRKSLILAQSARLNLAYISANAGRGESSQDFVFAGHNMIAENGKLIAESPSFENAYARTEIDLALLEARRKTREAEAFAERELYCHVEFGEEQEQDIFGDLRDPDGGRELKRRLDAFPFIPDDESLRTGRCGEILHIQASGLRKRMEHIGLKKVILGISGGLDSTLAILVCAKAFDRMGLDRKGIIAVTMPGFGTTDRTYQNACALSERLGASLREIGIVESMRVHFKDIGHDPDRHDVIFENAQARERTQILMDLANKEGALVVGTGDLSELALGWATYNGDHMSMYSLNGSVPKTLIRYIIRFYAQEEANKEIGAILSDILDTPVSPELLPSKDGEIVQKTENLVGPYELHDFFLYHVLRNGFLPSEIYFRARLAFRESYRPETILKWLEVFYRRFFAQQFKRSCLPDGAAVGVVNVSPRGGLFMPSDALRDTWTRELDKIKEQIERR